MSFVKPRGYGEGLRSQAAKAKSKKEDRILDCFSQLARLLFDMLEERGWVGSWPMDNKWLGPYTVIASLGK